MNIQNATAIHIKVFSVWTKMVEQPTDQFIGIAIPKAELLAKM